MREALYYKVLYLDKEGKVVEDTTNSLCCNMLKDMIFAKAMFLFLLVGFSEVILNQIGDFFIKEIGKYISFYYSTIPYVIWSVFSLYYFIKYYFRTAFNQQGTGISKNFMQKYYITKREEEIIQLTIQGLSNKAIAEKLFVSLATVKIHIHNILEKTGAKSRMRLLYLARDEK